MDWIKEEISEKYTKRTDKKKQIWPKYTMYKIIRVTSNRHMYDATEIFRTLNVHKKECFIKLAFYLCVS